jgi:hypothetical protein
VEASSADLSDDGTWWCTLSRTSGIGNTDACHRPRGVFELGKPGNVRLLAASTSTSTLFDCLDASPSSSLVASPLCYYPLSASSSAHGFLCGSLPSTATRRPRLPYVIDHDYSPSSLVASTSAQRATIHMSFSLVFSPVAASAPHRRSNCGGDVSPSAFAYGFFSSLTICGAPAVTAGEC